MLVGEPIEIALSPRNTEEDDSNNCSLDGGSQELVSRGRIDDDSSLEVEISTVEEQQD